MKDTPKPVLNRNGKTEIIQPTRPDRITRFLYRKVWSDTPVHTSHLPPFCRALIKILSIVFLKVLRDAVTFRARGLALTVVLALAPMLALGTAILKGVGISEETQALAHKFLDRIVVSSTPPMNVMAHGERSTDPDTGLAPVSGSQTERETQNLVIHVREVVNKVFDYVNRTDFATLGFAGTVAILILVASFFAHLETCMNTIWEVKRGRSPWKRGINYLAVLILLPIAMNLGIAAMAVLQSPTLMEKLERALPEPWMATFLLKMFPAIVVSGTFAALYKFIPNTSVSTLYSVSGGLLAGVCWLLVLLLYINLQIGVSRYNAIYGSFATVPLVLLWIYMGWVIFLIGAELVFAFQVWRVYEPWSRMQPADSQLALTIDVFTALKREEPGEDFAHAEGLAEILHRSSDQVAAALEDLERIGFIQKREGRYSVISGCQGINRAGVG